MSAKKSKNGVWVLVQCGGTHMNSVTGAVEPCPRKFRYFKTWNVTRRLCETCAEARTIQGKKRFEEDKKNGVARTPEDAEAFRLLKHIPNAVNWPNVLGRMAAEC